MWFRKSADQGYEVAEDNLARVSGYRFDLVSKSEGRRFECSARQRGAHVDTVMFGDVTPLSGNPEDKPPTDPREAFTWLQERAEAGDAESQLSLGYAYFDGKVIAKDDKQAVFWTKKAALQGNAPAQFNLAIFFYEGTGTAEDNVEAHYWSTVAAAQGVERAKGNKLAFEDLMTPEEIGQSRSQFMDDCVAGQMPYLLMHTN